MNVASERWPLLATFTSRQLLLEVRYLPIFDDIR